MYLHGHSESKSSNLLCLFFVSLTILGQVLYDITKLSSNMNTSLVAQRDMQYVDTKGEDEKKVH